MMGLQDCLVSDGPFCRLFVVGCGEHIELFTADWQERGLRSKRSVGILKDHAKKIVVNIG